MASNVFGRPITEGNLLERAQLASKDPNAGNKQDAAIAYIKEQQNQPNSCNGVSTLCIFYNATGETLHLGKIKSWYGEVRDSYPAKVQNGQWGAFLHVSKTESSDNIRSMGYVTYDVKGDTDLGSSTTLMGWENLQVQQNTHSFCDIYDVGKIDRDDEIYGKIKANRTQCKAHKNGIWIKTNITTDTSPFFEAYFKFKEAEAASSQDRRMASNVFGKPITEGSRLERARLAYNQNADKKQEEASAYLKEQKAKFGNGVSTMCLFYNATGETLHLRTIKSWYGEVWDSYPTEVQNGQWGAFLHVSEKESSNIIASMGYVIYDVHGINDLCSSTLLGWETPRDQVPPHYTHSFCHIYDDGKIDDNNKIYGKINANRTACIALSKKNGIWMNTNITTDTSPIFEAYFKFKEAEAASSQ